MTAVLYPDRFVELVEMPPFVIRMGDTRPAHAVYVRRRLVVCLLALGLIAAVGASPAPSWRIAGVYLPPPLRSARQPTPTPP